jgi:hypothetical protein
MLTDSGADSTPTTSAGDIMDEQLAEIVEDRPPPRGVPARQRHRAADLPHAPSF